MGFIVKIGCANLVFENKDNLISAFSEFINDPVETERKYYKSNGENSEEVERESQSEQQPSEERRR